VCEGVTHSCCAQMLLNKTDGTVHLFIY